MSEPQTPVVAPTGCSVSELQKEAEAWVKKNGHCGLMGPFPTRSCWNCNPAHEWMKTDMDTPYECYECGHIYFKGVRLTTINPSFQGIPNGNERKD